MNHSHLHQFHRNALFVSILLLVVFAFGCNKNNDDEVKDPTKLQTQKIKTTGLNKEEIDINGDGKPDQFVYTKDNEIRYAQRDFNFDQVIDMTEFYNDDGDHVRDEIDLDYDGIVDLIITYKNDLPVKKEYSIDFEGNRHGVQIFDANGNRTEVRRDTNRDGKVDIIEHYNPGEGEPYKTENVPNSIDLSKPQNTEDAK